MTDTEARLRAALLAEASSYDVAPGALARLQARTARSRRPRRPPLWLGLAGAAAAAAAVVGVAVLAAGGGGRHPGAPLTLGASSTATPMATGARPLPPAVTGATTLRPGFAVERTVLAGADGYVFGLTRDHHPVVARLDLGGSAPLVAVAATPLPGRVCSGSLDAGLLVVEIADGGDCSRRGTLRVLDSRTLEVQPGPVVRARGGDVLVRPEGVYVVDAGRLQLRDRHTMDVLRTRRVADSGDIVNLAGDPVRSSVYVTAFSADDARTRVGVVERGTLAGAAPVPLAGAEEGGLAYATATGFWLPFSTGPGTRVLRFDDHGVQRAEAFARAGRGSSFALSGSKLWSLDRDTHVLSCADLVTGGVRAASAPFPAFGLLAADSTHVLQTVDGSQDLLVLAPGGACR